MTSWCLLAVHINAGSLPKGLHTLDLSRNKITAIEGLRELTRLRVLDLSYNRISRIGHGKHCHCPLHMYYSFFLYRVKQLNILNVMVVNPARIHSSPGHTSSGHAWGSLVLKLGLDYCSTQLLGQVSHMGHMACVPHIHHFLHVDITWQIIPIQHTMQTCYPENAMFAVFFFPCQKGIHEFIFQREWWKLGCHHFISTPELFLTRET